MAAAPPRAPRGQWPPHWTAPGPGEAARGDVEAPEAPGRRPRSKLPGAPRRRPWKHLASPTEGGPGGAHWARCPPGLAPALGAGAGATPRALEPRRWGQLDARALGGGPADCPSAAPLPPAPASGPAPSQPGSPSTSPRAASPGPGQLAGAHRLEERRGGRGRHPNLTRRPLPRGPTPRGHAPPVQASANGRPSCGLAGHIGTRDYKSQGAPRLQPESPLPLAPQPLPAMGGGGCLSRPRLSVSPSGMR